MVLELNEYSYLWDGSESGWRLLKLDDSDGVTIFNNQTNVALVVDNEALKHQLCEKMKLSGVETITEVIQQDVDIVETGESAEDFFKKSGEV